MWPKCLHLRVPTLVGHNQTKNSSKKQYQPTYTNVLQPPPNLPMTMLLPSRVSNPSLFAWLAYEMTKRDMKENGVCMLDKQDVPGKTEGANKLLTIAPQTWIQFGMSLATALPTFLGRVG